MKNSFPLEKFNTIKISIKISGDKEIKDLNKKYLNKDSVTDVLSFNMNEELAKDSLYLGDIIVNKEQARRQAGKYGNDTAHEIADLIRHGILHLLGVHHKDDDENAVHGQKVKEN